MKVTNRKKVEAPEGEGYDFSGGVRGKYSDRYARGTNLVRIEPDVAKLFSTSEDVNAALRSLVGIAERQRRKRERGVDIYKIGVGSGQSSVGSRRKAVLRVRKKLKS